MPYLPLTLPPGVYRPSTRYDAKGRWYSATLVRWHENAMQPIGGWQALSRSDAVVAAAISDDGGSMTNETADANDADVGDVVLVPASPVINDALYIGAAYPFNGVEIAVSTAGTGNVVTWEYYNGSTWASLSGVTDSTTSFTTSGQNTVTFTRPSAWATTTVNSQGPYYYVRARVTTAGSTTALATRIYINAGQIDCDGPVRGLITWRANDESPQIAMGTPTKLWQFSGGAHANITPAVFTTGGEDASLASAVYGSGAYGAGLYGTGDPSQSMLIEANTWSLDTYGEDLVACAYSDGQILYWDKSAGGVAAALTNAPTSCLGVVVTPERMIAALGADGDGRLIRWCDQDNSTDWTAGASDTAGDFILPGSGQIMGGKRAMKETLIWTDQDCFAMRYVGTPIIYSFEQVGAACGAISRASFAIVNGRAVWMGHRSFFGYDGFVSPLPCEVGDYVFTDMNRTQASKIWCDVRGEYNEVTWYYPSGGSTECDRYVTYNYARQWWTIGTLARTGGADRGAYPYPILSDADGLIYQHEVGSSYGGLTPSAESGPIELGAGDNVMNVLQLVPDETTLGDVRLSLYAAMYPAATETLHGPYTMANPTSVRITGRQVRVKAEQVVAGWRLGTPRLEVKAGGLR